MERCREGALPNGDGQLQYTMAECANTVETRLGFSIKEELKALDEVEQAAISTVDETAPWGARLVAAVLLLLFRFGLSLG
jgi:hypothetical protein